MDAALAHVVEAAAIGDADSEAQAVARLAGDRWRALGDEHTASARQALDTSIRRAIRSLGAAVGSARDMPATRPIDGRAGAGDASPSTIRFDDGRGAGVVVAVPAGDSFAPVTGGEFVATLRHVDIGATGTPVLAHGRATVTGSLPGFRLGIAVALVVLVLCVRSARRVGIATVLVLCGGLGLAAAFGVSAIPLDAMPAMALPVGVMLVATAAATAAPQAQKLESLNTLSGEAADEASDSPALALAVLSGLVLVAGFAPLAMSDHAGMAGAGRVVAGAGVAYALAALLIVPALTVLGARATRAGRETLTKLRENR